MNQENTCPICGAETITAAAYDDACTQCDYVGERYDSADYVGAYIARYGEDEE